MRVIVKLFASEADAAGRRELALDLPGETTTAAELRRAIGEQVPALRSPGTGHVAARLAVNHEFADDATPISPRDEVALIGQVSGG